MWYVADTITFVVLYQYYRKLICKFSSGQTLLHQARFHKLNRMVLFRKVLFWKIFSSKLDLISSIKTYNSGNKGKTKTEQLICQRLPATYIIHTAKCIERIFIECYRIFLLTGGKLRWNLSKDYNGDIFPQILEENS